MKKILLALLIAAMLLSSAALADSRATELNGTLYLSVNGLTAVDESGVTAVDSRTAKYLQSDGEYLYYVVVEPAGEDNHTETLMRMDASGNAETIGNGRLYGSESIYADDYSRLTDYFFAPGYGDMTVYGDYIYFIGSNGIPGSYFTSADGWGDYNGDYETRYESASSVYRMNKNGSNLTELIPDLGNGQAHMDIANGTIAVATCWRNGIYAYDFSDFRLYDLNGSLIREIENTTDSRHSWIYKDDCEFTCIVIAISTDGERIYASLGDSEGDFASARLADMDDPDHTLALEAYFTPSVISDDGAVLFTSDAEDNFWDEIMDSSLKIYWENGMDSRTLADIPADFVTWGETWLSRVGDMVYLTNGTGAIRASISGGNVQMLGENGFRDVEEFAPAEESAGWYYLPDSSTRLYSEEELAQYDKETLGFMRNEILARHGYVFKKDKYKNHFGSMSWYAPNPDFYYGMLNDIEMQNVETIKKLEQ